MRWKQGLETGSYYSGQWRIRKGIGPYGDEVYYLYLDDERINWYSRLKEAKAAAERKVGEGEG